MKLINELTYKIIGAIYKVNADLGPGLLESVYEEALCYQLIKDGLYVERQIGVPLYYDGRRLHTHLRLDILVNRMVIVELKAIEAISTLHNMQLDTYLRLANIQIGLLVNFNTTNIRDDIHRRINPYFDENKVLEVIKIENTGDKESYISSK
ncbi:MAG: GxxExxY protein [Paludibacteraceae bacterium]|nr:GxxExxY protein [Paludibacteraceae bacterium]